MIVMKILWLCNVILPPIACEIGAPTPTGGGWLTGAANAILKKKDIQLAVCFPQRKSAGLLKGCVDKLSYYGFPSNKEPHIYDENITVWYKKILDDYQPDIVHIWGTEYPHSLAMTKAFGKPDKTIINIQGLCSFITEHYCAFLPEKARKAWTIRDFLRQDRIVEQQKKFRLRGKMEAQALQNAGLIVGRTRWDRACAWQLAPQAAYRFCNETLRDVFYENAGAWTVENCEKHSLFVSQSSYPIKGFHLVLEAMPEILKRYPDARLYTTGPDPFTIPFYRVSGYQTYLKKLISRLHLREKVIFLGGLDAASMCSRFLRSQVFVCPSSIENSPNSVAEAMLLGVPTVASYVGGTMDLLKDKEEGYLYQPDATYMLAHYVCKVFEEEETSFQMGQKASQHALKTHDPQTNFGCMMKIYDEVYKS